MQGVVWPLIVTMAIQALVSLVVYTPPVLAPVAQTDIGVPASAVGVVTSLIYFAATFTALSAGNLINRFGAMRVRGYGESIIVGGCHNGFDLLQGHL